MERYFYFTGNHETKIFDKTFSSCEMYLGSTIIKNDEPKETLIDYIDFSIKNGFDLEFVEMPSINPSFGGLIMALRQLGDKFGIKVEVKLY